MTYPSEASYSGHRPWKGLLILATVFSSGIQSESMKVEPTPPYGTVGSNITLSILGFSKEAKKYTWFRKKTDNIIVTYYVQTREQIPKNGREMVFPNGSLLITNLTLNDSGAYMVEIFPEPFDKLEFNLIFLHVHLQVYEPKSSRVNIAGIVIGVLAGLALTGSLIYFLFIRRTGRASQGMLGDLGPGECTQQALEHNHVLKSNIYSLQDSTPPVQGLVTSSSTSAETPENLYQALDVTKVDVYSTIVVRGKPQTQEGVP